MHILELINEKHMWSKVTIICYWNILIAICVCKFIMQLFILFLLMVQVKFVI